MPPASQASFRSSDDPDPFKISFLKGPKRKRLAKVPYLSLQSVLLFIDSLVNSFYFQQACDACHKSKRRCDGTGELAPVFLVRSRPDCASSAL